MLVGPSIRLKLLKNSLTTSICDLCMDQGIFKSVTITGHWRKIMFFFFNKKAATMNRKKQCIYIHMGTTDTNIYNWVGAHQSTKWFFIYHSSLEWTWNSEWLLVLRRGVNTRQNGEKRLRVGERTNYERNPNQASTKNLVGELLESLWHLNDWHIRSLHVFTR